MMKNLIRRFGIKKIKLKRRHFRENTTTFSKILCWVQLVEATHSVLTSTGGRCWHPLLHCPSPSALFSTRSSPLEPAFDRPQPLSLVVQQHMWIHHLLRRFASLHSFWDLMVQFHPISLVLMLLVSLMVAITVVIFSSGNQ
jgi:hypothetical protein